jgi:hypothetical protein
VLQAGSHFDEDGHPSLEAGAAKGVEFAKLPAEEGNDAATAAGTVSTSQLATA